VSTAALRCAGLRVKVTGADHARVPQPAVFLFNHQSQIDAFVVPYVLRRGFTAVVTAKARRYPLFGPLLRFVGVTFVNPASTVDAIRALEPLAAELKAGKSVMIAPEGRVSATPRLLPFKKGAFHLAIQAGVPIIPIVIRNSGEALWRSSVFVNPGIIDVAVLEPIDVSSWNPDNLDQHIERVRQQYGDALDNWPVMARTPSGKHPVNSGT
jgi:putative phosphoserine phosphatase/1-acylglycerol-3-phosphate O-acyltransferase